MSSPAAGPARYPRRILCATDFTSFSRRALEYAVALARPRGAEITVLHVLLLPLPSAESEGEPAWLPSGPGARSELVERMRRFAAPAAAAGHQTHLVLREGYPGDEIVRAAHSFDADLIVMGSHGRRGIQRLLGSHAEHVLRTAGCPVLIVSGPAEAPVAEAPLRIREILCAASGSEHSPLTMEYARCLAAVTGAHLTLLHVVAAGSGGRAVPPWAGRIQVEAGRAYERVVPGSPQAQILHCAREGGADLIVIGAHDRGPSALGWLGSTSAAVAREAECGVLTLKAAPTGLLPEQPRETAPAEVGATGKP